MYLSDLDSECVGRWFDFELLEVIGDELFELVL